MVQCRECFLVFMHLLTKLFQLLTHGFDRAPVFLVRAMRRTETRVRKLRHIRKAFRIYDALKWGSSPRYGCKAIHQLETCNCQLGRVLSWGSPIAASSEAAFHGGWRTLHNTAPRQF